MKFSITSVLAAALIAVGLSSQPVVAADKAADKVIETRSALRDLWADHIFWVRSVAVAVIDKNSAAATSAEHQVVANAKQIADSIVPFYGQKAGDQLFDLLKGHYGAIRQYLDASVANDKQKQTAATQALSTNASAIAKFLSGANPNLPYDAVNGLLQAHGGHHVAQINQLRQHQYDDEAKNWSAMRKHMNDIADALAGAIAKQFPEKI